MIVDLEIKSNIISVSGHYEFDTETQEEKCFLTIKSKLNMRYKNHVVEKELSNTIQISEPELLKAMRDANNQIELNAIMEKKLRKIDFDKRINNPLIGNDTNIHSAMAKKIIKTDEQHEQ